MEPDWDPSAGRYRFISASIGAVARCIFERPRSVLGHGLRDGDPRSDAELLACFVCDAATLTTDDGAPIPLAPHTLAWLENSARETLALNLAAPAPRGWWIEVNRADR